MFAVLVWPESVDGRRLAGGIESWHVAGDDVLLLFDELVPCRDVDFAADSFRDLVPVEVVAALFGDPDDPSDGFVNFEESFHGD